MQNSPELQLSAQIETASLYQHRQNAWPAGTIAEGVHLETR